MNKRSLPINNLKFNKNFYKKIETAKNTKTNSKKNIFNINDIKTYNEIRTKTKSHKNLESNEILGTVPNEINNINDLNKIKIIKLERNKIIRRLSSSGNESARFLSGTPTYFQPIITEISNQNKSNKRNTGENIRNISLNNSKDYTYKSNVKLLTKMNDLEKRNINNERIIAKDKMEKNKLVNKIQVLENIINNYKNISFDSQNKKFDYSSNDEERNKLILQNQKLKSQINNILKDNNELRLKIESIENYKFNDANNKLNIKNNFNNNINNNDHHRLVKNKSFIQKNSAFNKSFRFISNISLYKKNPKLKNISKNFNNSNNITNDDIQPLQNINDYYTENNNQNMIKTLKNEIKKKDSYINDLENEQKQNEKTMKKIIKENNNLLEQTNSLKKELNNKNKEILEFNDKKESSYQDKYNKLIQEIIQLKNDINILKEENEEKEKKNN